MFLSLRRLTITIVISQLVYLCLVYYLSLKITFLISLCYKRDVLSSQLLNFYLLFYLCLGMFFSLYHNILLHLSLYYIISLLYTVYFSMLYSSSLHYCIYVSFTILNSLPVFYYISLFIHIFVSPLLSFPTC